MAFQLLSSEAKEANVEMCHINLIAAIKLYYICIKTVKYSAIKHNIGTLTLYCMKRKI